MPRQKVHIPAYRLHKPSGQARLIIDGRRVYLGRDGSPESREKYARLVAELASPGNGTDTAPAAGSWLTPPSINELNLGYWKVAKSYYVKDGEPTKELARMRKALRPLHQLYGTTPAREFGPKALKAVRQHMIDAGLSWGVVNHRVSRIKRAIK